MKENKISFNKVMFTLMMLVILSSAVFGVGIFDFLRPNKTYSYLSDNGKIMNVVMVASTDLKVYQNIGETEPIDCVKNGIYLLTNDFVTDKYYDYDVYLQNEESSSVSASGYYIRWKFVATIDGEEYSVNDYCKPDNSEALLNGDYYYYVGGDGKPATFDASQTVNLLEQICFKGAYDSASDSYGSILDEKFSGSDFELEIMIEGSLTQYTLS